MEAKVYKPLIELVEYAIRSGLIEETDRAYAQGRLMELLAIDDLDTSVEIAEKRELHEILDNLLSFAYAKGLFDSNTVVYRDLFDTGLMGVLMPRPSEVIRKFGELYEKSPEAATDYFYSLCINSNYIRADRIKRDLKWKTASEYGDIDITVNLSKPEKDPKAIAAAKNLPQSGYPKCLLCHENEGYAGNLSKPARQNLRQIPFDMAGSPWLLQ